MAISNAAAGALNELTLGLSNRIAGVDGSCAGAGYGFGRLLGFGATFITPGGVEERLLQGAFSSEIKRNAAGEIVRYKTFIPNPRNPNKGDLIKRFDRYGREHFNKAWQRDVPTPHVHERYTEGGVRPPEPWEIP